mmetsp:Transcript_24686/g.60655  ORF Transcript_24686/g.60655 Transcript_24686/m.60655 type:complete len:209 (-) Transcript_24686:582-1208(-)
MIISSIVTKRIRNSPCRSLLASWNGARSAQPESCCRQNSQNPTRNHNSSSSGNGSVSEDSGFQIPKPTWSIQDLDLTSKRPPLPDEELDRLSKLALIDIKAMKPGDQESLGQDLANMLHMIDQVTQYSNDDDDNVENQGEDNPAAAQIYDVVRGVTKAPLRTSTDHLQAEDGEIAKDVWENMLQPNTKRMGGRHEYFAIQTKTETTDE